MPQANILSRFFIGDVLTAAKFIQIDITPKELGRNAGDVSLTLVGDISIVATQILDALSSWQYSPSSPYISVISTAKSKNESTAAQKAADLKSPMTYANAFSTIKDTFHALSPPEDGCISGKITRQVLRRIPAWLIEAHRVYIAPNST